MGRVLVALFHLKIAKIALYFHLTTHDRILSASMRRHIHTEMDLKASSLSFHYTVPPRWQLEHFFFPVGSTLTDRLGNAKGGRDLRHEDKVNQ